MALNNKSSSNILAALLVVAATAILGQAPRGVEAQGIINTTPVNVMISGIVPCTAGININPATVLVFPNAGVQLVCGNSVVANVTTSSTGAFVINLGTLTNLLANAPLIVDSLLNGQCRVVVTTPLATCNISLASVTGTLTSPVRLLNSTAGCIPGAVTGLTGIPGLASFITGLFSFS